VLVRMNALISLPWPDVAGGRYYWTHTAYMKQEDWASENAMLLNWTNRVKLGYTEDVLLYGHRIINPDDGTVIRTQTFTTPNQCNQDPVDDYNILLAGRWRFKAADGTGGYHLHRYPAGDSWVAGDDWTPFGLGRLQAVAGSMYAPGKIYARSGSEVEGWEVSPTIVGWQLRHGTKRRNSRFWLP